MVTLSENAFKVLNARYLNRDVQGNVIETPEQMFRRVSKAVASCEEETKREEWENKFYGVMSELDFLPNSPTLNNAGKDRQAVFACFTIPVPDSIPGIFDAIKEVAIVQKYGGGTGMSFSNLRPKNDIVDHTQGVSSGPCSFIKVFNAATEELKQGCVEGSTVVGVNHGLTTISSLGAIDGPKWQPVNVKVPTDTTIQRATHFFNNGTSKAYELITQRGFHVTATPEHNLRVIDEKGNYVWRAVKDIKKNDYLVLQKDYYVSGSYIIPKLKKHYHPNTQKIIWPTQLNSQICEFLGYLYGDGCIYRDVVDICIDENAKGLPEYLQTIVKNNFGLTFRKEKYLNHPSFGNWHSLRVQSKMWCDWLRTVGALKPKSKDITIPKCIWSTTKENVYAFVRGFWEADGNVSVKASSLTASSISEVFINELQILLLSVGVPTAKNAAKMQNGNLIYNLHVITAEGRQIFKEKIGFLSSTKKQDLERLPTTQTNQRDIIPYQRVNFAHFIQSLPPEYKHLKIKYKRYIYGQAIREGGVSGIHISRTFLSKFLKNEPGAVKRAFIETSVYNMFTKNQYYDRLVIKRPTQAYTCDVFVPQTNTYIANGFVSHNSVRRGANMGMLRVDHPDIFDFVTLKDKEDTLANFNISVLVTDEFMEAVENGGSFNLLSPRTKQVVRTVQASEIWNKIVEQAWKTGDPGLGFIERYNNGSSNPTPELGEVHTTNPCGESPLLDHESCVLGSINVGHYCKKEDINFDRLRETVHHAVRFLDNLVDINWYPIKQIEVNTKGNRKIGLGVMGFADLLVQMEVPYNSKQAVQVARRLMKFIQTEAVKASQALAAEKGSFPNFDKSIYKDEKPRRNAIVTTIAPTGTLSLVANCTPGIEPIFAVAYKRNVVDTVLLEFHPLFEEFLSRYVKNDEKRRQIVEEIKKADGSSIQHIDEIPTQVKRLFVTAHDIALEWHVKMQAAFQEFTENAVSKTANLPNTATRDDVEKAYLLAYQLGCKGITVFRDGCKGAQVMEANKAERGIIPRERPEEMFGHTKKVDTNYGTMYVTINEDKEGVAETFINIGKGGSDVAAFTEAIGRLLSICFRGNISPTYILKQLRNIKGSESFMHQQTFLHSIPDAIGYVVEQHLKEHGRLVKREDKENKGALPVCRECQGLMIWTGKCHTCKDCGYSKCL